MLLNNPLLNVKLRKEILNNVLYKPALVDGNRKPEAERKASYDKKTIPRDLSELRKLSS